MRPDPAATMPAASIHAHLRSATAGDHQRLDRGLAYLVHGPLSRERYGELLAALLGFYLPLETQLASWQAAASSPPLPLIRRAGLLESDLDALGRTATQVETCGDMPELIRAEHAAGAIYVVEGACLGGQVIARAVTASIGLGRETGAAFFIGDGPRTGARWKRVLAWLEGWAGLPGAREPMAGGAARTFAALTRWLAVRGVLDA